MLHISNYYDFINELVEDIPVINFVLNKRLEVIKWRE